MQLSELCRKIELPSEVTLSVCSHQSVMTEEIESLLTQKETWEQGGNALKERLGEDPRGLKTLAECLVIACRTYERYASKNIPDKIFFETMKFCTRFITAYERIHGEYALTWAW